MIPTEPKPYSRWRLTDTLDQLAETYDAAASAVDAFSRSAFFYDPMAPRPTIRARARASLHAWGARRGWPRTAWFAVTSILAIGFMAWISMRILGKLAPGTPPAVVAMVPDAVTRSARPMPLGLPEKKFAGTIAGAPVAGWENTACVV